MNKWREKAGNVHDRFCRAGNIGKRHKFHFRLWCLILLYGLGVMASAQAMKDTCAFQGIGHSVARLSGVIFSQNEVQGSEGIFYLNARDRIHENGDNGWMNKWRETAGKTKDGFRRAGDYGKRHKFRLGVWLLILVHGVGAITSIRAIMDTRTSQGAVAWAISLNTMPIIAVPAYWVFGRDRFHGYLAAQGEDIQMLEGASRDALNALDLEEFLVMPERQTPFVAEKLARSPFTRYNDVELCIDGEDSFRSMFDGIKNAKEYVLLQFYIVKHDNTGQELKKLLLEKVKEGVPIYFLYDKMGSMRLSQEYVRELQEGGVKMVAFSSTQGKGNRFQLNFRNHRKLLVVDGRVGWVGGINIGDEYIHGTEELGAWRDTMVKVEGPVVQCSQLSFLEDWYWAKGEALELQWTAQRAESGSDVRMLSLPSGPADALETCTLFYLAVINFAKERLWIATP